MTRAQLETFVLRRIGDPNGTQFDTADDLRAELNESVQDIACDVEISALLVHLHKRETINLDSSIKEYPIGTAGGEYLITRKVVRTDIVRTPKCTKIEFEELEAYGLVDGLNDQMGVIYAIGPMSNNQMGLILPVLPQPGVRLVHHYMRAPEAMATATSVPDGIPGPFHRLVGLTTALRLIGADNANQAAYIALQNETAMKREQMIDFLSRDYEPQEVEDVTDYG